MAAPFLNEGVFPHHCVEHGCDRIVEFDDEPWCFTHSPDEGSSQVGYSARADFLAKHGEAVLRAVQSSRDEDEIARAFDILVVQVRHLRAILKTEEETNG